MEGSKTNDKGRRNRMAGVAQETPYREMDSRGFRHCNSVYEKRLEATMTDIVTYCDINTCEDCPRYGDDCDGRGDDE